jgi:hypothetical protein
VRDGVQSGLQAMSALMLGKLLDTANYTLTMQHAVLAHKSVYDFDVGQQ